jgi:tetratricopeptide (TPR) repeat protein
MLLRFALVVGLICAECLAQTAMGDALNLLDAGQFSQAVGRLERAGVRESSDAQALLVLGVGLALSRRFEESIEPLERAYKLQRLDEATLWIYAVEKMSGIVTEAHAYGIRPPGQPLRIEGRPKYQSKEYPSVYGTYIYEVMAGAYMNAKYDQTSLDSPAIRNAFAEGAKRFVALRGALRSPLSVAPGSPNYPEQMRRLVQTANASDPVWLNQFGALHLNIGRYEGARRFSTLLLVQQPRHVNALLRRAWAAALMGDGGRARSDLERAAGIDAKATAAYRERIEADLAKHQPAGDAYGYLNELGAMARKGAPLAELLGVARRVHEAFASKRIVYEERYAEARAGFEASMVAQPGSADVRANYARYLVTESDLHRRAYSVEPRQSIEAFRMGFNAPKELARALEVVNQGLVGNPNHVRCLLLKAVVLERMGRYDEGRPFAEKALRLAPGNAEALRLHSEFLWGANIDALNRAGDLRTPAVLDVRRYDEGNERVTETTYRRASGAQLNTAAALEESAKEMRAGARAALQAALRASAGTPEGVILEAETAVANGRLAEAGAALSAGVARFPRSLALHEAYVRYAQRTRNEDLEDDERTVAFNLFETTAGPQLRKAWRGILRTDWPMVDRALQEAARLDPTDARTPAYRAIALEQQRRPVDAAALWMQAIALEEARLSFDDSPASVGVPRSPTSTALAITLRLRFLGSERDHPGAAAVAKGAAEWASRLESGDRAMLCWRALLPNPKLEERPGWTREQGVVWPPSAASLAAAGYVAYGRTLQGAAAQEQYDKALVFGEQNGRELPTSAGQSRRADRDQNQGVATGAIAEAYLEKMKAAMDAKDGRAALDAYNRAVAAKPSREVMEELDKLLEILRNPPPEPAQKRKGFFKK